MPEQQTPAVDLLEWNGRLPDVRIAETTPEGSATQTYSVIADYGWAERILCSGCYLQDALAIEAALKEAIH